MSLHHPEEERGAAKCRLGLKTAADPIDCCLNALERLVFKGASALQGCSLLQ